MAALQSAATPRSARSDATFTWAAETGEAVNHTPTPAECSAGVVVAQKCQPPICNEQTSGGGDGYTMSLHRLFHRCNDEIVIFCHPISCFLMHARPVARGQLTRPHPLPAGHRAARRARPASSLRGAPGGRAGAPACVAAQSPESSDRGSARVLRSSAYRAR